MENWNEFTAWWNAETFSRSDFLALIAILLSVITGVAQMVFGRSQHRVNKGVLGDRKKASEKAMEANVEVMLTGHPRRYVLEFRNMGAHAARNLRIEVAPGSAQQRMLKFALQDLPQNLAPGAGHKTLADVELGTHFPTEFALKWSDGRVDEQEKTAVVYLP